MSDPRTAISENQLFQQFTKSNQICTNSFQLIFDSAIQLQQENQFLKKLLNANKIKIPTQPLPAGTLIAETAVEKPNRQQRRKAERDEKKKSK